MNEIFASLIWERDFLSFSKVSYKPYSKSIQTAAVKSEKWKKKIVAPNKNDGEKFLFCTWISWVTKNKSKVDKLVFCFSSCSDLHWEKIVLVIENFFWKIQCWRKRVCNFFLRSLERFIQTVKGKYNIGIKIDNYCSD